MNSDEEKSKKVVRMGEVGVYITPSNVRVANVILGPGSVEKF